MALNEANRVFSRSSISYNANGVCSVLFIASTSSLIP
jgi:hypothetical protein